MARLVSRSPEPIPFSQLHERLGGHSLDLVHVAAAIAFGARRFVTADRRQAALARRAGLAIAGVG